MASEKLGNYEILEKIGAGGMGEVYRARDTRLQRDVALKLLPDAFAEDADRLGRFDREARLLAALNHPNIAAIYGLEQAGSKRFLVLELVPGEDLSARIARGALPLDEALPIAREMAEALEYAHEQGIVHRDLKPANVKLTPEGRVKVLDFGLAKALESEDGRDPRMSQSPTLLASSPTVAGVILGTAAYMSPEQARGKQVDKRSDIFAFGCVLYEMLTGRQTFAGDTISDTLAAVLKTIPDVGALPSETPRSIRELLKRCLEKDPKLRLRDIGEARIAIDHARHAGDEETGAGTTTIAGRRSMRTHAVWGISALAVAAAAFFGSRALAPGSDAAPVLKYTIDSVDQSPGGALNSWNLALSPDGTKIVYLDQGKLWVRELSKLDPVELPGTEGASIPFWSPDGTQVGFLTGSTFRRIGLDGSRSTAVSAVGGSFSGGAGACWTDDNRIVFTRGNDGLSAVSAAGGEPVEIVPLRAELEQDLHEPFALPGGRGFLYVSHRPGGGAGDIVLYADDAHTVLVKHDDGRTWMPRYAPSGHILYGRSGANGGVWALPFSLSGLRATGAPFLVAAEANEAWAGANGTLVYRGGGATGQQELVWVSRDGTVGATIDGPVDAIGHPALSPDGQRLAVVTSEGDNVDIWIIDIARGTRTRLTFDPVTEIFPAWTPDGNTIYYNTTDGGGRIFMRASDGTGEPQLVTRGFDVSLSADGRWIAFDHAKPGARNDVFVSPLPVDTTAALQPLVGTPARENIARISPRGDYIAYASDESGRNEVYLTRFPDGGGKWQVSVSGGGIPRWSKSGNKLFYWADPNVMEVEVRTNNGRLELGRPAPVFALEGGLAISDLLAYGVEGEGERFMVTRVIGQQGDRQGLRVTVVQNWLAEFGAQAASK